MKTTYSGKLMVDLDVGSIVVARLSIGSHSAIVLSPKEEIVSTETVVVVPISANTSLSLAEDLVVSQFEFIFLFSPF